MSKDDDWLDAGDCLNMCPQKYFWRYECDLKGLFEDSSALTFGAAIHCSMELLYTGRAFDPTPCPDCRITRSHSGCNWCKGDNIPAYAAIFLANYPDDPEDPRNPRTRARGLEILQVYLIKWGREPFQVLAVEQAFQLDLGDLRYVGKMDLVINYSRVMPADHKTTTFFGNTFEKQFRLSTQISGYIKACQVTTGEDVWDAMINALRVTTRITPDDSFFRMITSRTPEELVRWEQDVRHAMGRVREYRKSGFWPRHAPYSCVAYNKVCEYYNLCTVGTETQEVLKQTAYKVEPWNPLPT
jgi:hypothetical protein